MLEVRDGGVVLWREGEKRLRVEPWGKDSLRIRVTANPNFRDEDWALLSPSETSASVRLEEDGKVAILCNGHIEVKLAGEGYLSFRDRSRETDLLETKRIQFHHHAGDLYHIAAEFRAYEDERIYGLGQHQHGFLNQKGCVIDLTHVNMSVSIPFLISSRGYGLLWNNPGIGRVELGRNATRWVMEASPEVDYWITVGDYETIARHYADATGHPPALPDWALGFWQSKLRYKTQEELLSVAREYHRREIPLSVLVIDALHWTVMGDWKFDTELWPDPTVMVQELKSLGIEPMVSIWPTVTQFSENYEEMKAQDMLVRTRRGLPILHRWHDNKPDEKMSYFHDYDATNPEARRYLWKKCKKGYLEHGIRSFWLDANEPEVWLEQFDNIVYHAGDGLAVGGIYPDRHIQAFADGLADAEEGGLILARSAWAGSQRWPVVLWSGDVDSRWENFRVQVAGGLNMALSGVPWWTTDIGGFRWGDPREKDYQELLVRWFQYGAFCPIFRLHGLREPADLERGEGAPNEIWSYGEKVYPILRDFVLLRERLRPYLKKQIGPSRKGIPPMRPLFFDFPDDPDASKIEDAFLLGPDLLVAPVLEAGALSRDVYLPAGTRWRDAWTDKAYEGGQTLTSKAPLERIPLFLREGANLPIRG